MGFINIQYSQEQKISSRLEMDNKGEADNLDELSDVKRGEKLLTYRTN